MLKIFNNVGSSKMQNYFLIKKLKKIKYHFLTNNKDLKCKIIISKIMCKIRKNIKFIKKNDCFKKHN